MLDIDKLIVNQPGNINSIGGISYDALMSASIAILVFCLGLLVKWIYDKRKESAYLKILRDFFLSSFEDTVDSIRNYAASLQNLSTKIGDTTRTDFYFGESHLIYFDPIRNIPQVDLYKAFITRCKGESKDKFQHYRGFTNTVNFIDIQRRHLDENFHAFIDHHKQYDFQWKESQNNIFRLFDSFKGMFISQGIKKSDDPFMSQLDVLLFKSREVEDFDNPFVAYDHRVKPLLGLCKIYFQDTKAQTLLPEAIRSSYVYNDLKKLKALYSEVFKKEATGLLSQNAKLEQSIHYFRNIGFK